MQHSLGGACGVFSAQGDYINFSKYIGERYSRLTNCQKKTETLAVTEVTVKF